MPNRGKPPAGKLSDRIRAAMSPAGITTGSDLARRMRVNRQTVHRWLNDEGDKLTPEMLYRLADALECNARWLAFGTPHTPVRAFFPTPEEAELLALFRALEKSPEAQSQWLSQGRGLVKMFARDVGINPFTLSLKTKR